MIGNGPATGRRPNCYARWPVARSARAILGFFHPPAPAAPQAAASGDMAVTVARTTNVCFTDTLQVTGVVVPRNEILVRPDREGLQISQVLVEPGDTVAAGQVLARLAPPEGQQGAGTTVALQAPG